MTINYPLKNQRCGPVLVALLIFFAAGASANGQSSVKERPDALRAQLIEVQASQESLQRQLKYLEELSKPENIENSFAGVGSTHPEDLREARRRQLELEKTNIQAQLKLLADSQTRIESSIIRADAAAYNQSAIVTQEPGQQSAAQVNAKSQTKSRTRTRRAKGKSRTSRNKYP